MRGEKEEKRRKGKKIGREVGEAGTLGRIQSNDGKINGARLTSTSYLPHSNLQWRVDGRRGRVMNC